ncbi:hypothetical protein ABZV14_01180 [Streptosporangium canum]|uniref:hypothetical protein n=1 Tax=Streptosporangium canum TaxID=324952 RepID=UPI0033AEAC6C
MADEPAPLGPTQHDPAVQGGYAAQSVYAERMQAIEDDTSLSELDRAEAIVEAYEAQNAELTKLTTDLHERRVSRLAHLQSQVPTGPGIPDDASQADKAVLGAAFRAALEQARAAGYDQRRAMLADALKFGDDSTLRALLTAADENGDVKLVDAWASATGNEPILSEIRDLNRQLGGNHSGRPWEGQAFRAPKRPAAIANLPLLRKQAEEAARAEMRSQRFARPVYSRY